MSQPPRFGGVAIFVAATAILAALVHLAVVLLTPMVATRDAFARLAALGGVNETVALPRAAPSERLTPSADPALAQAFCRYDLASGPLRVRAPVGRAGFASISFHTRRGLVFYAFTDKAAAHGVMEAVLATPQQIRALAARDNEDDPSPDLRVPAPASEGFVVIRAFSELPSLYAAAETEARGLACKTEAIPP